MSDEPRISIAKAAKELGLNQSTLRRQIASGLVRSAGKGVVRLAEARADRAANVDTSRWAHRRGNRAAPQPKKAPRFDRNEPLPLGMCDSPGTLGDLAKIILGPGEPTNRGDLAVITIMVAHDVLKLALKERFGHDSDAFKHPDLKDCTPTTIEKLGNLLGVTAPGDHLEVGHVALGFALEILEIAAHRHDATT
jgi:hypothetical protein